MTDDELLDRAWHRGVTRADAAPLAARLGTAGERRGELSAFARLAVLLGGEALAPAPADGGAADPSPCVCVVVEAARAWSCAHALDGAGAVEALDRMESALDDAARSSDPRLAAARAWADLAIAHCALAGGDRDAAVSRFRAVGASAPPGARVAAGLAAIVAAGTGAADPQRAAAALERVAEEAAAIAAAEETAAATTFAGLLRLLAGDRRAARAQLTRVIDEPSAPRRYATMARLVRAAVSGDDGFVDLAAGLQVAAAEGDYGSYLLLVLAGVRLHLDGGDHVRAVLTLWSAIAQLDRTDPSGALSAPLRAERDALRARLDPEAFDGILAAALAVLDGAPYA